jgi:hypothetical protein
VAAGLLPFPATACQETLDALAGSKTQEDFCRTQSVAHSAMVLAVIRERVMQNVTRPTLIGFAFAASLAAAPALAANTETPPSAAAPTCRKAEVNPVTGHVLCLEPLGAPVEPPPAASEVPCKPDARSDEGWTWGPKCKPEKPGEG